MERGIRVLMGRPNMDGHWRGLYVVSRALREAGMEVIYTGYSSPEAIVESAIQEDVDVIGVSLHSCDNVLVMSEIMRLLKEKELDSLVVVGGTFVDPKKEIPRLKEIGIGGVFPSGSPLDSIVEYIKKALKGKSLSQVKGEM